MPYPNEHACRIREPGEFEDDSFRRIEKGSKEGKGPRDGKKLSIIIGKLKGEDEPTTQAYRYPTDTWTEEQAREHCKEEGGKFEAAVPKEESRLRGLLEALQSIIDRFLPREEVQRFSGSPRNRFGTHASYKFKGSYEVAWRCHFSKVGGGATTGEATGPLRGTVRRTEMIAAAMKPKCDLPATDSIEARGGPKSPLDCTFPEKPGDYGLDKWDEPEDEEERGKTQLTCSDLAVIKRAALAEIKRRAKDREEAEKEERAIERELSLLREEIAKHPLSDEEVSALLLDIYAPLEDEEDIERAIGFMRIREQVWNTLMGMTGEMRDTWLHEVYYDDGMLYAIISAGGKLYRIGLTVAGDTVTMGERVEVTEAFPPVAQRGIAIFRQADGRYRWVTAAATAILNRVGEIDSRALFDSFVAHAERTGEYPYLSFYHLGERFRMGQADLLARDGVVYVASGLWDESPLAGAFRAAIEREPEFWGASIGYDPTAPPELVEVAKDVKVPVYRAGVNKEISVLPEQDAANLFTALRVRAGGKTMLDRVKEVLLRAFDNDEEAARPFIAWVDEVNRTAEEKSLVTRETEPPSDAPPAAETPGTERTVELDEATVALIARQVAETEAVKSLAATVAQQAEEIEKLRQAVDVVSALTADGLKGADGRLAALERSDEDKRREWLQDVPRRETIRVTHRPREERRPKPDGDGDAPDPQAMAEAVLSKVPK